MPFTIKEFHDLVKLLDEQPEWRTELRRLVLTEELLALPELVRGLAGAQHRTEERVDRLESAVERLIEAQRQTEERVAELTKAQRRTEELVAELIEAQHRTEERVAELTEAQRHTEERVAELIEAQHRTDKRMAELTEAQRRTEERAEKHERRMDQMAKDLGELKGDSLERRYRERAPAYFSPLVRRVHVVFGDELVALLEEAVTQGLLLEEEADEVARADVLVRGRRREDGAQVYLVAEVSWGVGVSDVERAARRASFLTKTGTPTLPVVAGRGISKEAADLCQKMKVWQLVDGWAMSPEGS